MCFFFKEFAQSCVPFVFSKVQSKQVFSSDLASGRTLLLEPRQIFTQGTSAVPIPDTSKAGNVFVQSLLTCAV